MMTESKAGNEFKGEFKVDRSDVFLQMLDSTARLQRDIALILEAKAVEAEKSRSWICNHWFADELDAHERHMKHTCGIHDQLIEVIDGITKMEHALSRNLHTLLRQNQHSRGPEAMGAAFSIGGDSN
jgi:hypothetical protein